MELRKHIKERAEDSGDKSASFPVRNPRGRLRDPGKACAVSGPTCNPVLKCPPKVVELAYKFTGEYAMKSSSTRVILAALMLLALLLGCSRSHDPIAGGLDTGVGPALARQSSDSHFTAASRVLWGIWRISISADRRTVTVVPDRVGAEHFNVIRLIEVAPCDDCLQIKNLQVVPEGLSADVTLIHPFPDFLKYSGFDVRAIFISGARYTFPVSGREIAWGDDVMRMLDPDGYTQLFNPTDFPYTTPPVLGYIPGHRAPGGDLSATLNPYVAYEQDKQRCVFMPGTLSTRTVLLDVPPGSLEFGYAVDASWFPAGVEVTDPVNDFPLSANCMEAFRIDVLRGRRLGPMTGGTAPIEVEVFDHQGFESISTVTIEAPDVFTGEQALSFAMSTGDESFLFTGTVTNELAPDYGSYPLLVRVLDNETDMNLGPIDAWEVSDITIREGWVRAWGGTLRDWAQGVAVDGSGNVYATGRFTSTVDFNPVGGDPHTAQGANDVFLTKFDTKGNFQWARTWGGTGMDWGYSVAVDGAGDVYVSGRYWGTVDFNPDGGDPHTSNGYEDVFLSKFDSDGNFQWARTWGGPSGEEGWEVAADDLGNAYVAGCFRETVDFNPGGGDPHTANGLLDVFLSKFDSSGNFVWARTWGGLGSEYGYGLAVDGFGDAYVTGHFEGTVDFDPDGGDPHTSNAVDTFLSKFDSSGDFQWARTWGGPYTDMGIGVAEDGSGNVYATGVFLGTVDFNPLGGDPHTADDWADVFLSKFDSSGNFQWAQTWGGIGWDGGWDVAAAFSGEVYVVGYFEGTFGFDPTVPDPDESNGWFDIFLTKLNSSGNFEWTRAWGGPRNDVGFGVAADSSGNAYACGFFYSEDWVNFAPSEAPCSEEPVELLDHGMADGFVVKYLRNGCW